MPRVVLSFCLITLLLIIAGSNVQASSAASAAAVAKANEAYKAQCSAYEKFMDALDAFEASVWNPISWIGIGTGQSVLDKELDMYKALKEWKEDLEEYNKANKAAIDALKCKNTGVSEGD